MSNKILYNVTIHIEKAIQEEWLQWMISKHIPDVMSCDIFENYQIQKVIADTDDGSTSFAIQYTCASMQAYEKYQKEFAPALQKEHSQKFINKFLAIRTMMEIISSSTDS